MKRALSTFMFVLLLVSMLTLAFKIQPVKASGTIYIRADGSIDPPTAPIYTGDNITYTLTGNITADADGIVIERDNIMVDGAGYTIQGTGNYMPKGIYLPSRINVTVANTKITTCYYGIMLDSSSNNSISGNNITANNADGIWLFHSSSNNSISGNNIANNGYGIMLYPSSSYDSISGNNITTNNVGIGVFDSSYNSISGNNITTNNWLGIYFDSCSSNNSISGNNIANNGYGIGLYSSSNYNSIFHNGFVNNSIQVYSYSSVNIWDDGYPSGGNYWSDYTGTDLYSGSYQNQTGSDGIGDTPHNVSDGSNADNYPLIHPWSPLPVHNINTGLGYATIQEAIDANETLDGHTIFVEAGTYYENVVVSKALSLMGEDAGNTVIDGSGAGVVVHVTVNRVSVSGFTIRNSGHTWLTDAGVKLQGSSYCDITGNNLVNNCDGVYLNYFSSNNSVSGNGITTSERDGINVHRYSSYNTISGNKITASSWYGVCLNYSSSNNAVYGNNIADNWCGVGLCISQNTVFGNNITNNGRGVIIGQSTSDVFHNNLIGNTLQVSFIWGTHTSMWDDGYPSGGNYWSDYSGRDVFKGAFQNEKGSDGLGDSPYVIDANNRDSYPLMKPYPWGDHDIGITNIGRVYAFDVIVPLKTIVGLNYSMNVDTFVMNYGASSEVFNVTVYANESIIDAFENVTLAAGNSTILSSRWNTTGLAYGNYTIRAVASNVSGESDLTDNTRTDGVVYVGIPGDINADGKVDVKDIAYVARRFGIGFRDSLWNPNADINDDGKIDTMDVAAASRHFGEHYP